MKNAIGYITAFSTLVAMSFLSPVYAVGMTPPPCTDGGNPGIMTGIGCVPLAPGALVGKLFTISIGIAGGVAFLMILLGGIQIQTSAGNPDKINQGREVIEGAIIGLLLIIFSVFILHVVGIDIFHIPGFS